MCFPSTLSTTIVKEISGLSCSDGIVKKLSEKPSNLLVFFEQAVLDRGYVQDKFIIVMAVLIRINEFALSQVLKWDEVMKTYDHYLNFSRAIHVSLNDVELTLEDQKRNYSRILLMRHSETLRERWLKDHSSKTYHLHEVASYLNSFKQFELLYMAFLRGDFSPFNALSEIVLFQCLNQIVSWKCVNIESFETIVCNRIRRPTVAFGYYGFAYKFNLPLLFDHCKNLLNNFNFYVEEFPDCKFYTCLSHLINADNSEIDFSPNDLVEYAESIWQRVDSLGSIKDLIIEKLEFIVTDSTLVVRGTIFTNFSSIKSLKMQFSLKKKECLNAHSIKKVIADGQMQIRELSLIGLLLYLENVDELDMLNYSKIDSKLIERISEVKPCLKALSLNYCVMNEEIYRIVVSKFIHLRALNLRGVDLSKEMFSLLIGHLEELKGFLFSDGVVEIPENLEGLNKIEHFVFTNVKNVSKRDFDRLLNSLINVCNLVVIDVPHFSLASYPYPSKIVSLVVKDDSLEVCQDTISSLELYVKLEQLKVFGNPSAKLKKALVRIMKEGTIKVQFLKGNKF